MIRLVPVLLLAALVAAPSLSDAGKKKASLTIKKPKPLAAGLLIDAKDSFEMDALIKASGQDIPMKASRSVDYKVEVLKASGDRIDRAKVVYGTAEDRQEAMGQKKVEKDVRDHKTYLLEAGANGPTVSDAAGKPVTDKAEVDEVLKAHQRLLKDAPMRTWIVGKTFTQGKPVQLTEQEARDLFLDDADRGKIESFQITLKKVSGKTATFDFVGRFTIDEGNGMPIGADATGVLELDTGLVLPRKITVNAKLDATMNQGGQSMTMTGTLRAGTTFTYRQK